MPNQPPDPHGRFPVTAAIGLALMGVGSYALGLLVIVPEELRAIGIGLPIALSAFLLALIAFRSLARGVRKRRSGAKAGATRAARPGADPAPAFDARQFLKKVEDRRREEEATRLTVRESTRQLTGPKNPDTTQTAHSDPNPDAIAAPDRIKKLEDLRNHPATPEAEAKAADDQLKKLRRKRRSKERKPR